MQVLTDTQDKGVCAAREYPADAGAVDALLTASRSLIAMAAWPLGAAAERTTIARYLALALPASRGPQPMVDLAAFADAAGEVPTAGGRG